MYAVEGPQRSALFDDSDSESESDAEPSEEEVAAQLKQFDAFLAESKEASEAHETMPASQMLKSPLSAPLIKSQEPGTNCGCHSSTSSHSSRTSERKVSINSKQPQLSSQLSDQPSGYTDTAMSGYTLPEFLTSLSSMSRIPLDQQTPPRLQLTSQISHLVGARDMTPALQALKTGQERLFFRTTPSGSVEQLSAITKRQATALEKLGLDVQYVSGLSLKPAESPSTKSHRARQSRSSLAKAAESSSDSGVSSGKSAE